MPFLLILSLLSPLFVILLGIRQRFTLLWFYAAAGLLIDNMGNFLKTEHIEYHWAGNVFLLAEFHFISFYYKTIIFRNRNLFWSMTLGASLLFSIHTMYNSVFSLNMLGASLFYLLYIGYGLLGFYKLLQKPEIMHLGKSPFFIINVSFFVYSSANFLVFLFGSYLRENDFAFLISIWGSFFISINILHYLLIGIGLYKTNRN